MFSRSVTVDGKTYHICCTPDTPLSEVLRRAAELAFRDEGADLTSIDEKEDANG